LIARLQARDFVLGAQDVGLHLRPDSDRRPFWPEPGDALRPV